MRFRVQNLSEGMNYSEFRAVEFRVSGFRFIGL